MALLTTAAAAAPWPLPALTSVLAASTPWSSSRPALVVVLVLLFRREAIPKERWRCLVLPRIFFIVCTRSTTIAKKEQLYTTLRTRTLFQQYSGGKGRVHVITLVECGDDGGAVVHHVSAPPPSGRHGPVDHLNGGVRVGAAGVELAAGGVVSLVLVESGEDSVAADLQHTCKASLTQVFQDSSVAIVKVIMFMGEKGYRDWGSGSRI